MAETISEHLYVLDMDRTLLNSNFAAMLYSSACAKVNSGLRSTLHAAQQETEISGGSFGARAHLRSRGLLDDNEMAVIDKRFIELASDPAYRDILVYPDTDQFLNRLKHLGIPHMILTQTEHDSDWQQLKLQASGLGRIPHAIASTCTTGGVPLNKGDIIASWQQSESGLIIPQAITPEIAADNLVARAAVLCDDKAKSFRGLPPGSQGYWLQRSQTLLPSQLPDAVGVQASVQVIHDLTCINL